MPDFSFTLDYCATVNFAQQQNHVPVIRRLVVHNDGTAIQGARLALSAQPAVFEPVERELATLPQGEAVDAGLLEVPISPQMLANQTERLAALLRVELQRDGVPLHSETYPLDVLAYDEWGGLAALPELIAAFVTPNNGHIAPLLAQAAALLGQWTGNPSLDGYQSNDANRVHQQAAAAYAVLQGLNITYCEPPASFEQAGQRVRLSETVLETRLGTCLDTTLLYASVLEAMGLHPLVVFTRGHAFAGVWLEDESFPETVQDDVSALTKRTAAGVNGICVVETTAATAGRAVAFDAAERLALGKLAVPEDFVLAVDVKRARAAYIRPLPERVRGESGWQIVPESRDVDAAQPGALGATVQVGEGRAPLTKQQQWERRLLDLSLRNTLVSLRRTKLVLPLLTAGLSELEDALSSGDEFQVLERPQDWQDSPRDERLVERTAQTDPIRELLKFEFQKKRLRTELSTGELSAVMTGLYRAARTALEENGANTLYLTLGLLKWYETPASQKPRFAPLVLIPIEILRKSAQKGYVIRLRDDEPQMNITLLEMLHQDFGLTISGLDPLPTDEHGVDIRQVFAVMRRAVMGLNSWDVLEDAFIGIFSFSQFVMWNDMRNRAADLARSKVVSSLTAGRLTWQCEPVSAGCQQLDDGCEPAKVFLPITADASQLEAVMASAQGKSFVLHGPPGTGKSQTITNIIANALAQGKTVLFVAEKMAALSVVQRRLSAIGIGPFCLELHSNKSKKKDVLEQLRTASETARTRSPEDFAAQAERLAAQRQALNAHVQALHTEYPFGLSLYRAISIYGSAGATREIAHDQQEFATLSRAEMDRRMDICRSLVAAARNTGHPSGHALGGIALSRYSQGTRAAALAATQEYIAALQDADHKREALCAALGLAIEPRTAAALWALADACGAAGGLSGVPAALLAVADVPSALAQLNELIAHGRAMTAARASVLSAFREDVFRENGAMLLGEWQRASVQWFLPRALGQNRIAKQLLPYSLQPRADKAHLESHLRSLAAWQAQRARVEAALGAVRPLLGLWWREYDTNWDALEAACALLGRLDAALAQAVPNAAAVRGTIAAQGGLAALLAAFDQVMQALLARQDALAQLLVIDFGRFAAESDFLATLQSRAAAWRDHMDELREWAAWIKAREEAAASRLKPVVDACEAGMALDEVPGAYLKGRCHAAAEWILSQSALLRDFSGAVFEDRVRQFKDAEARFEQLTRQEIAARLAARVPNFTAEAAQNSQLGILQRAIRSGGRGLSIRKLFESIPDLLPRLSPCMLMSPISVAQYLDPGHAPYDLVVFDEASQLPTCKAVGAIARGQDVIVVGDPRQLPPTSFFANNTASDDDEEAALEDLESILDDCLALSMPQSSLLWHYRSRHESLIAFSNSNYYENKLLTFPSPRDLVSSVRHVEVSGNYDRGKTKQNMAEAQAVVAEILRRLGDENLRRRSIGVVTFSSPQQNLIDDLLTAQFAQRPDLEEIAMGGLEPLFIKNLENVQGDERDVILFSVGYGPDRDGRVTLNFGPLNREGGWRRLNVAVSRAREEMIVFSTLRPEQLDASRTAARGVAGLKAFLEYARNGKRVLAAAQAGELRAEAGIEAQIAAALLAEGYAVHTNVGCSGYRINAAVVHPQRPGEYNLGILCDGDIYRQARTARDRELAQEAVLRQLGWNIRRVWALDWWDNPAKETRKLVAAIRQLVMKPEDGATGEGGQPAAVPQPPAAPVAPAQATPPRAEPIKAAPDAASPPCSACRSYTPVALGREAISPDEFVLPQNAQRIARKLVLVVNGEGPVSYDVLCTRVLQSFGIGRMGTRIAAALALVLSRISFTKTTQQGVTFYWPTGVSPTSWEIFRVSAADTDRRDAADIPKEEAACAVREVLRVQIGLPRADLAREAARLMGYAQTGTVVAQAMGQGIDCAVERGWAREDGKGGVSLA